MGTYRDNTPNYNVNKVIKFSEFDKTIQKKEKMHSCKKKYKIIKRR